MADLLTRIRNANLAYKDELIVPVSKLAESILKILRRRRATSTGSTAEGEGVRAGVPHPAEVRQEASAHDLRHQAYLHAGRRVYAQRDKLPRVLGGLGVAIVSTSQGVMTDKDASSKGIGGEVLAFVW